MSLILSGTDGLSDIDGSAATPAIRGTDANTGIFFGTDIIGFSEGGVECARFNADSQFVAAAGTAALPVITTTGDTNTGIFFPAADTIAFSEGGVEAMRIDSGGNLGIGVTPSAWDSYANNIQTPTGSMVSYSPSANFGMVQNAYFSTSGWKYSTTNAATFYLQSSGVHSWSYASSGTAGNAVTFNEAMRIDTSGNVIVGGTSTSSNESTYQGGGVFVSRRTSSAGTTHANFLNGGSTVGSITSNTTTTFYNTTSDYRLKENATPITNGLQTISALNPVNFDWISKNFSDTGFLAHEFQSVIPNSVMGTKDAIDANGNPVYQQIDRSGAIPFLVAAIQEQQALITALTARITALETP